MADLAREAGVSTSEEPRDSDFAANTLLEVIAAIRRAIEAAEQLKTVRAAAEPLLRKVLSIAHRTQEDFDPLTRCRAEALTLIEHRDPAQVLEDLEAILSEDHPLAHLIQLVEAGEALEDEEWARLEESVAAAFGRPLAIAAVRGKLIRPRAAAEDSAESIEATSVEASVDCHSPEDDTEETPSGEPRAEIKTESGAVVAARARTPEEAHAGTSEAASATTPDRRETASNAPEVRPTVAPGITIQEIALRTVEDLTSENADALAWTLLRDGHLAGRGRSRS